MHSTSLLCAPLLQIVLRIIKDGLKKDPTRWTRMAKQIVGVSEETTTGVKRLYEMQEVRACEMQVVCWYEMRGLQELWWR